MRSDKSMMVSICMITYNHENYIREAIEGVLMQQCNFRIELIIGEDFSTDKTRQICQEYASTYPFIYLLPSESNLGMIPNFVRTLQACNGRYVALCEGDDYWTDPLKVQKQVDFLEANKDYSICFHNVQILQYGELINDFLTRSVPENTDILELAKGNYLHTPSVVFQNKLIDSWPAGFYSVLAGDYFLHMLNAKKGKIKKLSDVMAVYRIHENSVHSNKPQTQKNDEWLDQLWYMIPSFEGDVKTILVENYLKFAKGVIFEGNIPLLRRNQILQQVSELKGYII